MSSRMDVQGAIFDVDGTLVDSNDAHALAWATALREVGIVVPVLEIRRCIGMGGDKLLRRVAGISKESPLGKTVSERRKEIFRTELLPRIKPSPGSRDLLLHMRKDGVRLAIASSAERDELDALLRIADVEGLPEVCTSADDAERSKPDPDIVIVALERLDLPAEKVIMVGDTPYDIEAARRAGIRPIALRCGGWGDEELRGAWAIYDDPADLLARGWPL